MLEELGEGNNLLKLNVRPLPIVIREEQKRCRRDLRERLLAQREAMEKTLYDASSAKIRDAVLSVLQAIQPNVVAFYWPIRHEPDLLPLAITVDSSTVDSSTVESSTVESNTVDLRVQLALPVVVGKRAALEFRIWTPGEDLELGAWNIPIPSLANRVVLPDVVLVPLVGYHSNRHRLGYGGGYYDRTLSAATQKPLAIGVGFAIGCLESFQAEEHDVAMDMVVTEKGIVTEKEIITGKGLV